MSLRFDAAARQRMAVLASSTALFILVDSGFNVVGPLWATSDLGLDNAGWAFLRSAAEFGGLITIVGSGILSDRLGARRMSALALLGAAMAMAGLAAQIATLWLMMILGAFVSTVYVSFNTLAQSVSCERQSLANAIYRAAGAFATVLAPVIATQAGQATGDYASVLWVGSLVLAISAGLILFYSEQATPAPSRSFRQLLNAYGRGFTTRPLLAFILLTRGFGAALAAVSAFAALRFTRELSLSEPDFGVLRSSVAVASLVAVLGSGWVVDRLRPSRTLAIAWFGCGLASLVMGLSDSLRVTVIAYAIYAPLLTTCSVPLSLWGSHIAQGDGPGQTTVFTVAKVFQSGITMLSMALLGVLEPLLGMTTLMACGGLLALPFAVGIMRLGREQKI